MTGLLQPQSISWLGLLGLQRPHQPQVPLTGPPPGPDGTSPTGGLVKNANSQAHPRGSDSESAFRNPANGLVC